MEWNSVLTRDLGDTCHDFKPDGTYYRFGHKDRLWATGFEHKGKDQSFIFVAYGDWKSGAKHKWQSFSDANLSAWQKRSIDARVVALKNQIELEQNLKNNAAAQKWHKIFEAATTSEIAHPYLINKGIASNFLAKISNGDLLIPLYLDGNFRGVQRIYLEEGQYVKRFPSGTGKRGCSVTVNPLASGDKIFISEGFATACSIALALPEHQSICCFDAGNIYSVVENLRKISSKDIIICADLDENKTGELKATAAAQAFTKVSFILPKFHSLLNKMSDFNDLHHFVSLNEVTKQLTAHCNTDHLWPSKLFGFTYLTAKNARVRQYDELYYYFHNITGFKYIPDTQSGYRFNGKFYEPMSLEVLNEFADVNLQSPVKNFERQEFIGKCKARAQVRRDFLDQQDAIKKINFNNGVLDLEKMILYPHSIAHPFTYVIPNDYKVGVPCPTWEMLLDRIFLGRKHLIENLEEFLGFCLSRENYFRFNQALILDGEGSNGKSTLIDAMKMVIGTNNCEAISLAAMGQNRFLAHKLFKSMVNFCEEEPKSVFTETGPFKKITGNSPMFAEEKNKTGFSFVNKSKIIISYNEMPFLGDETTGMRRRLLILPCEQDFESYSDRKILNVLEKISEELPGIIERCVTAYKRLSARGHFKINEETKDRFNEMRMASNPVYAWWCENIDINLGNQPGYGTKLYTDDLWLKFKLDTENKSFSKDGFMRKIASTLREANKANKISLNIQRDNSGKFIKDIRLKSF